MTWSQNQPYCLKSEKIYISISKITENVRKFQNQGAKFWKKWHHTVLLLAKNPEAGCLFRPNFLKRVVIEIQTMKHPRQKFSKYPPVSTITTVWRPGIREPPTSVFQLYFHLLKLLKALLLYMLLLSSISNKDVLFIFSANKVTAEEVPPWVPLEQKVVKDVHRLNSSTYLHN